MPRNIKGVNAGLKETSPLDSGAAISPTAKALGRGNGQTTPWQKTSDKSMQKVFTRIRYLCWV